MATHGSFTSREAQRGTRFLQKLNQLNSVPDSFTLLFEIIDSNQGIVKYNFGGLVLLAIFDWATGHELAWSEVRSWADRLGCGTPATYPFGTFAEVLLSRARLPADLEGYVIRFESGLRVKLKGNVYLREVAKLTAEVSRDRLLEALASGTIHNLRRQIPE